MAAPRTTEELLLRAEVEDLVTRYATAIDTRDWVLFSSVFADDAQIDYGPAMGQFTRGADFTKFMREGHEPAGPSVHRMTNVVVNDGDVLSARTYGDSLIAHKDDQSTVDHGAAYYDDVFVRTEDGLRIASRKASIVVFERLTGNTARL
jgi:3-phenylpropionate/cinnamic acid dioxygenase small subunit